ncbi:MAG: chitobiase/beta-hexosaminidase C-terminal domain-containing protein, partial [Butyrivibrio sp.]
SNRLTVKGNVNLIISDGVSMNANAAINIPDGCSLTIYGQEEQTGKLYVPCQRAGWRNAICLNSTGKVTLYGGILDVTGGWNGEGGIGGGTYGAVGGTVTVNRGQLIAAGSNSSALTTNLIINGGEVDAKTGGADRTLTGSIAVNGGTLTAVNTKDNGIAFSVTPLIGNNMKLIAGDSAESGIVCNYADWTTTINNGQKYISVTKCDAHSFNDISICNYCNYIGVTPPVSSLKSGNYWETQSISLSSSGEGDLIYYTTDGTEPTSDSTLYEEPVLLKAGEEEIKTVTVKAITVNPRCGKSSVAEYTYTIYGLIALTTEQKTEIAGNALAAIGCGYVYGMAGPKVFDNAGLVYFAYKETGIKLPRLPESMEMYLRESSAAVSYETLEYMAEKKRFRINPEAGDIVIIYTKNSDGSIYPLYGTYTKRENEIDYVVSITGPSTVVEEFAVNDLISRLEDAGRDISGVAVYKIKNKDNIEISNVELENEVSCGQPLEPELECGTTGVDRVIVKWTDEDGNEVSGNADVPLRQYTMHLTIIPESGYVFTDASSIILNNGKDAVSDVRVNADGTLTGTMTIYPVEYLIVKGEQDESITFTGNGSFSSFYGVKIDGKLLDKDSYEAKSGSTVITLKPEYLNSLSPGKHTLEILWTDGMAGTVFTVKGKTTDDIEAGDLAPITWMIVLMVASGSGVVLANKNK